jgi:hypothetical protein
MGPAGRPVAARRLPNNLDRSHDMRRTIALAALAVIVVIIAVQFAPSLVSH